MTSVDKDFRFMATNDLMTELQNDSIKLDDDSERKVIYLPVLKLLFHHKITKFIKLNPDCKNFTQATRGQEWWSAKFGC